MSNVALMYLLSNLYADIFQNLLCSFSGNVFEHRQSSIVESCDQVIGKRKTNVQPHLVIGGDNALKGRLRGKV